MSELVFVTNNSEKSLTVEFAYKEYTFPAGKTVDIPLQAARHIFGYGDNNKEPYLSRLGFIRLHSELDEALERLSKFELSDQPPQTNRSLPSAVGVVPLPVERQVRGKSTQRAA